MNSVAATDAFCYWLICWLFSFSVWFNHTIDQTGIKKKDFFEKDKGLALFPKTSWKEQSWNNNNQRKRSFDLGKFEVNNFVIDLAVCMFHAI